MGHHVRRGLRELEKELLTGNFITVYIWRTAISSCHVYCTETTAHIHNYAPQTFPWSPQATSHVLVQLFKSMFHCIPHHYDSFSSVHALHCPAYSNLKHPKPYTLQPSISTIVFTFSLSPSLVTYIPFLSSSSHLFCSYVQTISEHLLQLSQPHSSRHCSPLPSHFLFNQTSLHHRLSLNMQFSAHSPSIVSHLEPMLCICTILSVILYL